MPTPLAIVVPIPKGAWNATAVYNLLNVVTHDGRGYICKAAGSGIEPTPTGNSQWQLIADRGEAMQFDQLTQAQKDNLAQSANAAAAQAASSASEAATYAASVRSLLEQVSGSADPGAAITAQVAANKAALAELGTKVDEKVAVTNEEGYIEKTPLSFISNPEYIFAIVDAENRLLFGFRFDGSTEFAAGVPKPIKDYVESKIGGIDFSNLQTKLTLEQISAISDVVNKVTKEDGKGLIDVNVSSSLQQVNNSEFISVTTDNEDNIIEGIDDNGRHHFYEDIVIHKSIINIEKNAESKNISDFSPYELSRNVFPETLSIADLLSIRKARCIFHDNYVREDNSHTLDYVFSDYGVTKVIAEYEVIKSSNATFDVGIKDNHATTYGSGDGIILECKKIEDSDNYHITFERGDYNDADAKVAFNVKDTDNLFFCKLTKTAAHIYAIIKGTRVTLFSKTNFTNVNNADIFVEKNCAHLYVNGVYRATINAEYEGKCGIMFVGNEKSMIKAFVLDIKDNYSEYGFDNGIEAGNIDGNDFDTTIERVDPAGVEAIFLEEDIVNNSNRSIKVLLQYFEDAEAHFVAASRRAEFKPIIRHEEPLRSFVLSFDVLFPSEKYKNDAECEELFWQNHTNALNVAERAANPNVTIYNYNGVLYTTIRASKRYQDVRPSTETYSEAVNKKDGGTKFVLGEIGNDIAFDEWHNITIYMKEGYEYIHRPRTVIYIDGVKKMDVFAPNVYNCPNKGNTVMLGIYKWPWKNWDGVNPPLVTERTLFFDNIKYFV